MQKNEEALTGMTACILELQAARKQTPVVLDDLQLFSLLLTHCSMSTRYYDPEGQLSQYMIIAILSEILPLSTTTSWVPCHFRRRTLSFAPHYYYEYCVVINMAAEQHKATAGRQGHHMPRRARKEEALRFYSLS
jgi:hypothetical protein